MIRGALPEGLRTALRMVGVREAAACTSKGSTVSIGISLQSYYAHLSHKLGDKPQILLCS